MNRGWQVLVLLVLADSFFVSPHSAVAQQPQQLGKIIGIVHILRGDFPPVPVLVTLEARGAPVDSAYTDGQGHFGFSNLVANEYRISVNDEAYKPQSITVDVNPTFSPVNFVPVTLEPRDTPKKEDSAKRVSGSNPYLIDPAEYYRRFPKKTIKEFQKGVDAEKQARSDEAIAHYEKALEYSSDFYPAHNNLGSAYLGRHQFADAQTQFEAAIKANQNDPQAHLNLANLLLLTQHYDTATIEIEEGLKRDPNSAFGHFLRGSLYSHTSRPELSEKELMTAIQFDPKMSQAYLQLVNLYLHQKRVDDAVSQLETYLKSFPDSPLAPKVRETLKRLQAGAGGAQNPR